MITRRRALFALAAALLAPPAPAQERRVRRIGFLVPTSAASSASWLAAFREGMADLRWIDERDYVIDARYANGAMKAVERLAAELVAMKPDLLLTPADTGARSLAQRTDAIPIVFVIGQDPVGIGIAASLQRPGGHTTGLTNMARDLSVKRLQLLKEAFPRAAHVALLFDPTNMGALPQVAEMEESAVHLGMRVTPIRILKSAEMDAAFKRGAASGANAFLVIQGALFGAHRRPLLTLSARSRTPTLFPSSSFVEQGGLMSYAPSYVDNFRRAATYVDRILKGARPGDLPIEQPTKFELVINMKTARAMGLTIPQSVLLRADRVIE